MKTIKTRVLLADDHAVLRAGLRMLIEAQPDMTIVDEAGDGLETLAQVERLAPDVLLLDLSMPRLGPLGYLGCATVSVALAALTRGWRSVIACGVAVGLAMSFYPAALRRLQTGWEQGYTFLCNKKR